MGIGGFDDVLKPRLFASQGIKVSIGFGVGGVYRVQLFLRLFDGTQVSSTVS